MKVFSTIVLVLLAAPSFAFAEPAYVCRTKSRVVVIESTGPESFRYSAWNNKQTMSDKPELVLNGGTLDIQGTGPCRTSYWTFKNGLYAYTVSDSVACGPDQAPKDAVGDLSVSKNDNVLSTSWCLKTSSK